MTRINLVHVEDLADQHLFAEWREIKMIPAKLKKLEQTKLGYQIMKDVPKVYTLSTGHVRFFYDKMRFLYDRYNELTDELHKRYFNIAEHNADEIFFRVVPEMQDPFWKPTKAEIAINIGRITERLNQRPSWYRYFGEIKSPEFFINRYNQQLMVDILS